MIRLVIESIIRRKRKLSLIVLQFIIGFICLLIGLGILEDTMSFKETISSFTSLENIHIYIENNDISEFKLSKLDKYINVIEKLKKMKIVDKFGLFEEVESYRDESMEEISKPFYMLNEDMFSLLDFDVDKGEIKSLLTYNSDNKYIPVLVSKALENQYYLDSIHDIYFFNYNFEIQKYTIKVVGVISEESVFFIGGGSKLTENIFINKEYIIAPKFKDFQSDITYEFNSLISLKSNHDINKSLTKINETFESSNIIQTNKLLKEEVEDYYSERKPLIVSTIMFAIIILLISVLGFIGTILSSIISRKKEFGVYFSLGFSKNNLIKLVIGEIIILFIVSFLLANIINFLLSKYLLENIGVDISVISIVITLISMFGLILTTIIIPINNLSKLQPIDLIKERNR